MKTTLREEILNILKRISEMDCKTLAEYDVKDEAETKYGDGIGGLEKIHIYKKAQDGFDADVSLFSIVCYAITYPYVFECDPDKEIGEHDDDRKMIRHNKGQKYEIMFSDNKQQMAFHGDTMNSFQTMANLFDQELTAKDENFWCLFDRYAKWVHTIGNFVPVPHYYNGSNSGSFNCARYTATKDFWDVALYHIYKWYKNGKNREELELFLGKKESDIVAGEYWLNRFHGWDDFVVRNYMQPFVEVISEDGSYGEPKAFWKDHFQCESGLLPNKEEAEVYLTDVSHLIESRGKLIAEAIKNALDGKNLEEYAEYLVRNN